MKKILRLLLVVCASIALAQIGFAQAQKMARDNAQRPGAVKVEAEESIATVDTVDYENRTGTLKLLDGTMLTFKFGPEVRNFDEIKVGDQVILKGTR
jgi:hypothetical protein